MRSKVAAEVARMLVESGLIHHSQEQCAISLITTHLYWRGIVDNDTDPAPIADNLDELE